jgi:hypothetical protein
MIKTIEIFENEEAEQLLDYFMFYKKLTSLADNAKRMATTNSQIIISRQKPTLLNK